MQDGISVKQRIIGQSFYPKTSTPIRARVISKQPCATNTPINHLKHFTSPNNKQNINCSNIPTHIFTNKPWVNGTKNVPHSHSPQSIAINKLRFSKATLIPSIGQGIPENGQTDKCQVKLSPILSLTKKNNCVFFRESNAFSSNAFRSLTPNPIQQHQLIVSHNSSKQNLINRKKGNPTVPGPERSLNQSFSSSNLRNSNSFSHIFQQRSKTPTRIGSMAFKSIPRKKDSSPGIHADHSLKNVHNLQELTSAEPHHQLFNQSGLAQSFLHQNDLNNSAVHISTLMCANNHSKMAKYRMKSVQNSRQHQTEDLVYCSKCAIDMVQKGFSVQQLPNSQLPTTTPKPLRQSQSFKNTFSSFKPTYTSQILEHLKKSQHLKSLLLKNHQQQNLLEQQISQKYTLELQAIDCYYNSLISHIETQKNKDKQTLQSLKNQLLQSILPNSLSPSTFLQYHETLEQNIKNRTFNSSSIALLQQIQHKLANQTALNLQTQFAQILYDEQKRLFTYPSTIQQQFDSFVAYFDTEGKLDFRTFVQTQKPLPKNHALRFSFEKALQNQTRKNLFIHNSDLMKPLQQESEEEYDENSFSHDHMTQTAQSTQHLEQKPFRTLFAEQDDIFQPDDLEASKDAMYSPTFKAI